jgi:crotonobetainyl-CoA:carnitine CoA-transferase CaiB-like acyl-CoA transferase
VSALPLAGITVVDLTTVLMGPFATQALADYGADVIKVEAPTGDPVRGIGPARHAGMGAIFLNANRNKRSIVLDLRDPDGMAALRDLIARADVLAYNLRPQAMEQLGLAYDSVRALNPSIIYLGMFGFARGGPYAGRAAYDDLIQGMTGIPALTVIGGSAEPRYVPLAIADRVCGMAGVNALLLALVHRLRTGEGQSVDVTMFETMASLALADHLGGETFVPQQGPLHYQRLLAPDRRPCRTRDGWLCIMVYTDRQWRDFFRAIGREAEFDATPEYADITRRTENIARLYAFVAEILRGKTTAEWLHILGAADVPVAPMLAIDDLLEDPQVAAAGLLGVMDHPTEGTLRVVGDGIVASRSARELRCPAPRLGEHSAELLRWIGRSDAQIAALAARGVTRLAVPPAEEGCEA